ncbi:MAG: LysM peptidoglycan-binding domain-containing protein [Daejeonella sp.]
MYIKGSLSICFLLLSFTVLASLTADSTGVENLNGKKTIIHQVEVKETYYSIARKYMVSPLTIIQFNSNAPLQPGITIKVPTDRPFVQETNTATNNPAIYTGKSTLVEYKVGVKETLYSISRKFNTTVEELKSLNNLTDNSLTVGQVIKVKYGNSPTPIINTTQVIPKPATAGSENPPTKLDSTVNAIDRLRLPPAKYGLREVDERGVATWIDDENMEPGKMLALHGTAQIGTIVKITNPMTGKTTFAKVVGKFSPNESTKDVLIVLSKAAADALGALDKRFQVSLIYGVPNE